MPGFPFIKLPLLAQLNALNFVKTSDLIVLSFCSKKTRDLVTTSNHPWEEVYFRYIGDHQLTISMGEKYYISCKKTSSELQEDNILEVVGGKSGYRRMVSFQKAQTFDSVKDHLTEHIVHTFPRVETTTVDFSDHLVQDIPLWKYKKSIDNLFAQDISPREISAEEMNYIFNELTITEELEINHPITDGYQFSRGFQTKFIRVWHANWVHWDAILNSTSESIDLNSLKLQNLLNAANVRTFLQSWISEDKMKDLQYLGLRLIEEHELPDQFFEQVLEGIPSTEHSPEYHEIKRKDGRTAMVRCFPEYFDFGAL